MPLTRDEKIETIDLLLSQLLDVSTRRQELGGVVAWTVWLEKNVIGQIQILPDETKTYNALSSQRADQAAWQRVTELVDAELEKAAISKFLWGHETKRVAQQIAELGPLQVRRKPILPSAQAFLDSKPWEQLSSDGPEWQREAVKMWCKGRTYTEMTRQLAVSAQTIQNRFSKLRRDYPDLVPTAQQLRAMGLK